MKRTPLTRRTPLRAQPSRRDRLPAEAALAMARDRHTCQFPLPTACWGALHAHHLQRRSQGGSDDAANLVALCAGHHAWVHDHPAEAQALGLLVLR